MVGQRLLQAQSDSFLGWTTGEHGTHYYWRQFKDMKGSLEIDDASLAQMRRYAQLCGWTLARAHARSGDAAAIAGIRRIRQSARQGSDRLRADRRSRIATQPLQQNNST